MPNIAKAGRPSKYTPEIVEMICDGLENGRSLIDICKELDINYSTITKWLQDDEKKEFFTKYTRARENQAHYVAEKTIELADEQPQYVVGEDGVSRIDPAWVSYQKQRIDTRKWYAGKLNGKYSEKTQGDTNIQINTGLPERLNRAIERLNSPEILNAPTINN